MKRKNGLTKMTSRLVFAAALSSMVIGSNAYGRDSRDQVDQLLNKSDRVFKLIERNAFEMSSRKIDRVSTLLGQIRRVIKNNDNQNPWPGTLRCADERPSLFQDTFKTIKNFAYQSSGLNMNSNDAKDYALTWTEEHGCSEADHFISTFKKLKNFAYQSSGLNMNSNDAKVFALKMSNQLCPGSDNFESEFKEHYNFAYQSSGLNMNSNDARNYAWNKIENRYFACSSDRF